MAEPFAYVREYYGVPAQRGRRVTVYGDPGVIAEDRGHYIGVNFDASKPGVIDNCHPSDQVVYLDLGVVRRPTRSQARYQRYMDADCSETFIEYCRWEHAHRDQLFG